MLRMKEASHFLLCRLQQSCRPSSSAIPELPPCDYKPESYKGLTFEEAKKIRCDKLTPNPTPYYNKPVMITQGYKQWLWDHTGKRYLDMFAGIVTVSVGHCHLKVIEAATKQLNHLWHTTSIYMYPAVHEYAEKLTQYLPEDLKVCYFCNSGSEANDLAMLMARLYTGAFDVISLRNAYHGASPYVMGLCGIGSWKFGFPNSFGIHHAMNPDPYRGIWGGSNCRDSPVQTTRKCSCSVGQCQAADRYAEQLQEVLDMSLPKKRIAAFFAESIQGVGGTVQFPKGYIQKVAKAVRQRGGLYIADEVQTGFGRTGSHYWGFQSHDVVPDIVTMAKGIGNGFPLAAVVTTPDIAKTLSEALIFNTYGGNPVACAVGSAVLDVIEEEKCMRNSEEVGTKLLLGLAKLRHEFEIIGDVRGKGLMIGIEMVENKETKVPLAASRINTIFEDCKDMGLLIGKGGGLGNVFRLKPPMIVTQADAEFCLQVLKKTLEMDRERNS